MTTRINFVVTSPADAYRARRESTWSGTDPTCPACARYPHARFVGQQLDETLARHVASADVLVFPSRTDTFGVVLLEAMACGVPVAAPVTGPRDVVEPGRTGALDEDLGRAVEQALGLDPRVCVASARTRTWQACTAVFESFLVSARGGPREGARDSPLPYTARP